MKMVKNIGWPQTLGVKIGAYMVSFLFVSEINL